MKPAWVGILCVAVMALLVFPASAQMVVSAKSGVLNLTDGQVFLNAQPVEATVTHYPDVKEGNTVRTEEGRAEILLTPGVVLRLGDHGSLKMIANRLIDTRLELLSGSAVVEADQIAKDTNVTIVVANAAVTLPKAGLYRFDTQPPRVKVFKGEATVAIGDQTTPVGAGRQAALGGEQAVVDKFDVDDTDALDRWSHRRGELMAMANVSAAKSLLNSGYYPGSGGMLGCNSYWGYNSYFGMMTFIPCSGALMSPYGYRYWSPYTVTRVFYRPPAYYGGNNGSGNYGTTSTGYSSPSMTSGGYSGTMAAPSSGYSGSSMSSSGSSAASAGSSSAGHSGGGGGASAGGHGH
jgi:hypothetical protein